jgi:hypothetical protein
MHTQQEIVFDAITQAEIVHSLAQKVKSCYIFPDIAEHIAIGLNQHLEDGDYFGISEGEFFALALTIHMQEVNHDEHLWVRWHPETLPEDEGPLRLNQAWQEGQQQEARLDNFGIHKLDRLPGNVGYIDIHYFHRPAWGGDTAVAAMDYLAQTQALIIDLRQCTGGFPGMIALICSYLFGEEPVQLVSIYWRDEDFTQQYWTLPYIPGRRFVDNPVFVLTSGVTFSGGEMFAIILQSRQRATLIGGKTDGGANAGASYRLHPNLEVFIPIGRSINPLTGTNWEGIGVTPDILVPSEQAFKVAYRLALESILARLGESPVRPFKALAEEAQKALDGLLI